MNTISVYNQTVDNPQIPVQKMELAARNIEKALLTDSNAPRLIDLMNINPQTGSTASGLTDQDYPILSNMPLTMNNMNQIKCVNNVPLPPEIVDHFTHVQCHCMMGLFAEISRAWLTVDSDIYVWTYEENNDLAYFDGINETILCVGLVKPKPGVFHAFIKYLLVLTTAVDIIVLGVTFTEGGSGPMGEIQLIPDPVFTIPTDGVTISTIAGTSGGRLFLGTKEGCLYEISYQAESGWFGKRCKKVNLSTSALSFLVPSFLNAALSEEDGICQISVDNSRHILYTLTEKGSIEVCDLGEKGNSFSRITKISQTTLVNQAMNTVKTLDSQNFRPIVGITALEAYESGSINLVAVSQTGVRFYMSVASLSNLQPNQRPYTLTLVHVRLPPGYSANVTVRPRAVHMCHYRDRNLILISTVNEKDVLWCMSSDLFPFSQSFMEAYNTVNLDGPALAIAEVRHDIHLYSNTTQEAPPMVVRQHAEARISMPVDLLKQILKESRGLDSEALKTFFLIQKEDQASATSLILASLDSDDNVEVAEYATRAFFMFGREPRVTPVNPTNIFSGSSMFSPNIISTPAPHQYQQNLYPQSPSLSQTLSPHQTSFEMSSPFTFSSRHNGICLYFARIVRLIWHRICVERVCMDGKTVTNQSTITSEDCIYILNNLTALRNFLMHNTQLSTVSNALANPPSCMYNNTSMNASRVNHTLQDAQLEERVSLDSLKSFVVLCCQIIGLWRILCEHQFHSLIGALPENQQQILQNTTFQDLILLRQDICSILIMTLINSYLGDNASVDSISSKLREVCPHLYRTEDAAFSKANEILKATRTIQNIDEREEMLFSALQLCKSIAPNINLSEICREFTALRAYKAVIELCLHCGQKIDPDKIAENYYNSDNNTADQEGFNYYQKRMKIYKQVLNMLDCLYVEQSKNQAPNIIQDRYYTTTQAILLDGLDQSHVGSEMQQVMNDILDSPDQILHMALYEWMVTKNMASDLIKIGKPSLETYLKHTTTQHPNNIIVMDLLWKFYESNGNHTSAAKMLSTLASRTG
ncbi:hypothetical protein NQ314_000553 [Rhamnusium bicolor]|uniref:Nuclear pore complex protein Nup155 n=1 Tax=Rhamnusium bicolor TaxID=1586634 RepID=A0AAV8ZW17_9CUCU|nr:hypothetical protein NQ314_000553 [Rhamnusium bicolor]